jgi:hypothetical protein
MGAVGQFCAGGRDGASKLLGSEMVIAVIPRYHCCCGREVIGPVSKASTASWMVLREDSVGRTMRWTLLKALKLTSAALQHTSNATKPEWRED